MPANNSIWTLTVNWKSKNIPQYLNQVFEGMAQEFETKLLPSKPESQSLTTPPQLSIELLYNGRLMNYASIHLYRRKVESKSCSGWFTIM